MTYIKGLIAIAENHMLPCQDRLKAIEKASQQTPRILWTPQASVGSSPERIAFLDDRRMVELANALAHRMADITHPPPHNFMKHTGLLAFDHPDFGYMLTRDFVNPASEQALAEKLRKFFPGSEDLISEFVGCNPL